MTFSAWEEFPRFDQIFNQERNFHSYLRLTAEEVPAAPFLEVRRGGESRLGGRQGLAGAGGNAPGASRPSSGRGRAGRCR
jgi:hypothetical protein